MQQKVSFLAKKCIACLVILVIVLSTTVTSMAAGYTGDLNGDNAVSAPDLVALKTVLLLGDADMDYDVNGDGSVNIIDLIRLKKLLAQAKTEVTESVLSIDGKVSESVTLASGEVSAYVPVGVLLEDGVSSLTLTVIPLTSSGIPAGEGEKVASYDVHISGISKDNTVPIIIDLGAVMPKYLNMGNYKIYHIENGEEKIMTLVASREELIAHNQFIYEPETGKVTVAMATFSEIALVSAKAVWEGEVDYSWYTETIEENSYNTEFTIANADQLAGFSAIVGGMAKDKNIEIDDFSGKTVKLLSDIDLGYSETKENNNIFYPIGYYNSTYSYEKVSDVSVTSNVSSFEGVFDGNGHTVKNFYQNTWDMFGDYNNGYSGTPNHYKDAMGLFGYVYGGTVKNLTVNNFSSDGEFTPTGVIAAYASNATFENIAITNCNPRVYNTGNGGIVGIGGNSDDPDAYKLTFTNITIDNTNKITALWGSWDVACGGLVGMFRGAGHAYMTNCHVAAQMDVYNDVCGNYQYYWYRYSGMMIGTNNNMTTDANGYTVPETSKFHAENCTVHFGDWNNYYYCELVDNSLASYTHDHQFSRLTEVDSIDVENKTITIDGKTTAIPTSGRVNYVVVNGDAEGTEYATCYHFKDNAVWNHANAGYEDFDLDGNGELDDLKENNQHIYLPFNQLFTGYGWGVKHIPVHSENGTDYFDGITIHTNTASSEEKFAIKDGAKKEYNTGDSISIGEIFQAVQNNAEFNPNAIQQGKVQVFISPADANSIASGKYTPNNTDWKAGTLSFSGSGKAIVTITDYHFCKATSIEISITGPKFEAQFAVLKEKELPYDVVGNKDSVTLGTLFKAKSTVIGDVSLVITCIPHEDNLEWVYTENANWIESTIKFTGTGVVKLTIKDSDIYCAPAELFLMVTNDYSNENLALSAKAVASTELGEHRAYYVNDGDRNVAQIRNYGWTTEKWLLETSDYIEDPMWVQLEWDEKVIFDTVNVLEWDPVGNCHPTDEFALSVSDNGKDFETIFTGNGIGGFRNIRLSKPIETRYLRLQILSSGKGASNRPFIDEIEVYRKVTPGVTNLAQYANVESSGEHINPKPAEYTFCVKERLTDGDKNVNNVYNKAWLSDAWDTASLGTEPMLAQLVWSEAVTFNTINIYEYVNKNYNDNTTKEYEIFISDNGVDFTSIYKGDRIGANKEITFSEAHTAKYLRLHIISTTGGGNRPRISEIEVYNNDAE